MTSAVQSLLRWPASGFLERAEPGSSDARDFPKMQRESRHSALPPARRNRGQGAGAALSGFPALTGLMPSPLIASIAEPKTSFRLRIQAIADSW
jgi:hypothetical protein